MPVFNATDLKSHGRSNHRKQNQPKRKLIARDREWEEARKGSGNVSQSETKPLYGRKRKPFKIDIF